MTSSIPLPSEHVIKVLTYVSWGFNILMALLGVAMAIYTFYLQPTPSNYDGFLTETTFKFPVGFIIISAIIVLAVVLLIYGSYKKMIYVLLAYIVALIVVFIVEGVVGVGLFNEIPDIKNDVKNHMENSMRQYPVDLPTKRKWDEMQKSLKCCGTVNPAEWFDIIGNTEDNLLPGSCCLSSANEFCSYDSNPQHVYQIGCQTKVLDVIGKSIFERMLGLCVSLQVIQLINLVIGIILAYVIWDHHRKPILQGIPGV